MSSAEQDYTSVPLTLLDATTGNTDIVIQFSLIFPKRLSFEVLEESWYTLVSAWPIVSARIRKSETAPSGLEYQIPLPARLNKIKLESQLSSNPKDRQFYCLEKDGSIESYCPDMSPQHSSASSSFSGIFTAQSPSQKDLNRVVAANAASDLEEYLSRDCPLVSCQVTRFSDATIVSFCVSHVIGDGFSVVGILKAWQNIMDGKGPPPPLQDLGDDPFLPFGPQALSSKQDRLPPPPKLPQGFYLFNWKEKVQFVSNFLYDLYVSRPESIMQQRYVFLPREQIELLQRQTALDLQKAGLSSKVKIGKSDILYAWLMKHSHASLPRTWYSTPLTILNVRGRPPNGATKFPRHDFWGAAYAVPLRSLQVGELMDMSIGELAYHVRTSLNEHSDADSSATNLKFQLYYMPWKKEGSTKSSSDFPFFCPPSHRWSGISDWRALKLFDLDYGAAIQDNTRDGKSAPLMAMHANMSCKMSKRDRWVCVGDSKEGTWLTGYMSQSQWDHPQGFGKYTQRKKQQQLPRSDKSRQSRL